jgi:hypothetical protein
VTEQLVTLPASLLAQIERLAARAVIEQARRDGLDPAPGVGRLFAQIEQARRQTHPASTGTPTTIGVTEAARQMGCTPGWVRQLLAVGRLAGRRSGGVWLVDLPLSISPAAAARVGKLAA